MNGWWLSFNKHSGPSILSYKWIFSILAILDVKDAEYLSETNIRLVIVTERPDDFYSDLELDEYPQAWAYCDPGSRESPRTLLLRNARYHRVSSTSAPTVALFFEARKVDKGGYAFELLPVCPASVSGWTILFDKTYRTIQGQLLATLRSTVQVLGLDVLLTRISQGAYKQNIVVHTVRLLPLNRQPSRALPSDLPFEIIRHISIQSIEPLGKNWRRDLLSCGLVNKSWSKVLDVFYQLVPRAGPHDRPSIFQYLYSLQLTPDRARHIHDFCLTHFNECNLWASLDKTASDDVFVAATEILEMATQLRSLRVSHIGHLLGSSFIDVCPSLRSIEKLHFGPGFRDSGGVAVANEDGRVIALDTIPAMMALLPNLSYLEIVGNDGLREDRIEDFAELIEGSKGLARSNLVELDITAVQWSNGQFIRLFDTPAPRLTKLSLWQTNDLSNEELRRALMLVCKSLAEITVYEITSDKSEAEEHALDSVMPHMYALRMLDVTPDCYSGLSISRKPPGHATVMHLRDAYDESLEEFMPAFEACTWGMINIYFYNDAVSPIVGGQLEEVAAQKGFGVLLTMEEL